MNKNNIEKLLNEKIFNNVKLKKKFYILMCCNNCKNQFVEGGCCSQSYIEPVEPIKLFTKNEMIEYITPNTFTENKINDIYHPFIFLTLEEYLIHF
jgi:hypothetical protein